MELLGYLVALSAHPSLLLAVDVGECTCAIIGVQCGGLRASSICASGGPARTRAAGRGVCAPDAVSNRSQATLEQLAPGEARALHAAQRAFSELEASVPHVLVEHSEPCTWKQAFPAPAGRAASARRKLHGRVSIWAIESGIMASA